MLTKAHPWKRGPCYRSSEITPEVTNVHSFRRPLSFNLVILTSFCCDKTLLFNGDFCKWRTKAHPRKRGPCYRSSEISPNVTNVHSSRRPRSFNIVILTSFCCDKTHFFQQRWSRRDYTHPFVAGTALQAVVVAQEVQFASPFAEDDEDDGAQDHQRDDDTAEHDAPH